eukprot:15167667-Alexandrium_andersonii.AAC.1
MSASLVGSEMCIRDRRSAGHREQGQSEGVEVAEAGLRPEGLAAYAGPVSYTHLTLPTICSV